MFILVTTKYECRFVDSPIGWEMRGNSKFILHKVTNNKSDHVKNWMRLCNEFPRVQT